VDLDDDLPQITPRHLRSADDMCRRRLAHEVRGGKYRGNKAADMRFEVSNRLEADAQLAHATEGLRPEAFVEPRELEPEQRALYRAARKGYLDLFGDEPARFAKLERRVRITELDVELSGSPGLTLERDDGTRQVRKLRLGTGAFPADAVELRFALVCTEDWAPDGVEIVTADLIQLREHRVTLGTDARDDARAWITDRVALIAELAADGRALASSECGGCPFIAGCPAHA
jgi:hypothetical protein